MNRRATFARDAGLALVSRINRWLIVGSIGMAGVVAAVAQHSFHGHSTAAAASQSSSASSSSGAGSIAAPAQAPSAAVPAPAAQTPVVSGGS